MLRASLEAGTVFLDLFRRSSANAVLGYKAPFMSHFCRSYFMNKIFELENQNLIGATRHFPGNIQQIWGFPPRSSRQQGQLYALSALYLFVVSYFITLNHLKYRILNQY